MEDLVIGYKDELGRIFPVFTKSPEVTFVCARCGKESTSGIAKSTEKKKRVCYDCVDARRKEYNRVRSLKKYHERNQPL